jgi:hypothetical protein
MALAILRFVNVPVADHYLVFVARVRVDVVQRGRLDGVKVELYFGQKVVFVDRWTI